jgi:hypothetical protein
MNGRPLWLTALGLLCLSACDKPESSSQPAEKNQVAAVKTVSAAQETGTVLTKKNDVITKTTSKPIIDKKQLAVLASRYTNRALSVVDASEITLDGASAISLTFSVPLDPDQNFADLVQITDEDKGVTIFERTLKAGETYNVPNGRDLNLTTGNVAGVSLLIDGAPMPRLPATGKVARGVPLDPEKLKSRLTAPLPVQPSDSQVDAATDPTASD